jgi:hypothetical protein
LNSRRARRQLPRVEMLIRADRSASGDVCVDNGHEPKASHTIIGS